jgi:polyisoprenyl-phosphate glycosyltransferase
MKDSMKFSIIIPVFNEEGNIPELYRRLTAVMEKQCRDDGVAVESYEIIMVDDGSKDSSWKMIRELSGNDRRVKGISFSRNFGQHPAIMAGFRKCSGDVVILMDADLQNPPEEIPRLIDKLKEGYELVYGVRAERKDSVWRRIGSRIVHKLFLKLLGGFDIPDAVTAFRAMRRKVIESFLEIKGRHFYIAALMAWMGFKSTTVKVRHDGRYSGQSKYKLSKLIFMTMDMIVGFTYKPLKIASISGFTISAISFLFALYIIIRRLFFSIGVPGYASIIVAIAFFSGLQILFLGIIGEYIARIYREAKGRPYYIINEETG